MKTIWKFKLPIEDCVGIAMPVGAEILTAQLQGGALFVWATVDTKAELEDQFFGVFGTGQPVALTDQPRFVATVQAVGEIDTLVMHVFHFGTLKSLSASPRLCGEK